MLSQTANYAIRAMAFIARNGGDGPVLSRTISERMDIPKTFLSKILHRLVQEKLVRSVRGTGGGFTLARPANEISLHDVAEVFSDLTRYRSCFLGLKECDGSCAVHHKWAPVQESLFRLLEETTVDQVL